MLTPLAADRVVHNYINTIILSTDLRSLLMSHAKIQTRSPGVLFLSNQPYLISRLTGHVGNT